MELKEKFKNIIYPHTITSQEAVNNKVKQCAEIAEEFAVGFMEFCDISQKVADFHKQNRVYPTMDGSENMVVKNNRIKLLELYKQHLKTNENG